MLRSPGRLSTRRENGKDARPESAMAPAIEPVADGCREATAGPAFPPVASRAQHMDDAADDRRSFIRRAPGWPFGKNGSMPDQASSESQNP